MDILAYAGRSGLPTARAKRDLERYQTGGHLSNVHTLGLNKSGVKYTVIAFSALQLIIHEQREVAF